MFPSYILDDNSCKIFISDMSQRMIKHKAWVPFKARLLSNK